MRILGIAAQLLVALACSGEVGVERSLSVADATPVVLVSVDTLRSDRLPAYGYDGVETPAIDRLRRDGILFERAYTHVPLTLPAHTSLLTGLLPPAHGVRDNLGYTVDAAAAPLLQQTLKKAGYATGAGVSAYVLRRATGIGAGFDFYQDDVEVTSGPGVQAIQRPGAETLQAVRPWLRTVADGPFFLFFHIFEPHSPYEPPDEFARRYPSPYDGEVAAADQVVGDLLKDLANLGVYDKSLIVFLSDHGEGLGDHGEDEHGLFLYRSTLQVPLILKLPQAERAGETVEYPVQLIDVYPTLVSALGLPHGEHLQGTSLLDQPRPEPRDIPIYAETFFPRLHFGWSDLAALVVGRYHFIDAPLPELYDLLSDPNEADNLVSREPALEQEFRTALSTFDRELKAPGATDSETRRRLQALGYVGEASTANGEDLPDPKTKAGALAEIRDAYRLYADGDYASAAKSFKKIVTENPGIEDAWEYLALAQLGLGRMDEAVVTYQGALEQLPNSKRFSLRLAMLLYRMGRLEEAFVQANLAIPYDAMAAHVLLAQIAFSQGDLAGAEIESRDAMSRSDGRPGPYLVLADVYVARGDPKKAVELLSQAMADGITDESVRAKLAKTYIWIADLDKAEEVLRGFEETDDLDTLMAFGRLANSRQRWSEARGWFERALVVDPNNPTVKLNLGIVILAEGNVSDARQLLEEAVAALPGSFEGWNALGMIFAREGDAEGAIAAWERALEIKPGAHDLLFNLGLACAQAGHLLKAVGYLEDFAARAEGPQRDRALAIAQRLRSRASQNR